MLFIFDRTPGYSDIFLKFIVWDDNFISANQAADIISQSGLGSFDQITLDKYLSDKNVTVKPYINELFEGIIYDISIIYDTD